MLLPVSDMISWKNSLFSAVRVNPWQRFVPQAKGKDKNEKGRMHAAS
jgi:hypothetical protein